MSDLPETYIPGFHNEEAIRKMKYSILGKTGLKVSILSLGTGGFCQQYGDYTIEKCRATLVEALKNGVNYIDTAPWYGHGVAEEVLGKCLEGVPRKAYYVATKVGRYEADPKLMFDFSTEKTKWSIDNSLKKLKLDYVDIIQAHDVEFAPSLKQVIDETLPVLAEAVKQGKARFIGVTGYPVSVLKELIQKSRTNIDLVLSYSRLTPIDNTLKEYLPYFQGLNLGIVNAAGTAMGLLTNPGPQAWHPATQEIKDSCSEAGQYCKQKGVELARYAVDYAFHQPGPHTHLIGVNTPELLKANLDVLINGLRDHEKQVFQEVQTKILSKIQNKHWENIPVIEYRKAVGLA